MISNVLQKWIVGIVILLGAVHPQVPMMPYGFGGPMMMPPPMPMPVPMPVPVPVGIPIPYPESTTTTTTTTESNNERGEDSDNRIPIAIPIPMPHFVQIAIPGFMPANCMPDKKNGNGNGNGNRNKSCPPCPPCSCNPCTPSFFAYCSPCHLECRCKNGKENPSPQEPKAPKPLPGPAFPMPIPMPAPPPVVIVPFPQYHSQQPRQPHESDCDSHHASDSCSEDSKPSDSWESDQSRRKRKRRRGKSRSKKWRSKYDIERRNFGFMKRNRGDNGMVKPVLTYMSRNGDIKKRRLSNDEANVLLGHGEPFNNMESYRRAGKSYNNVRLSTGEDSNNRQRVVVVSKPGMRSSHHQVQQILDEKSHRILGDGRKELVFKTPENKKISNLSVSFQITK